MSTFYAILSEFKKIRHSTIVWITFVAFALAPIMGGLFILILRSPVMLSNAELLKAKATMMAFTPDWNSYLGLLCQALGVGGVLVFGFVASWIFGREYSDRTVKDLLALPTSRSTIIHAKFTLYVVWSICLALSNLMVGLIIGATLALPGFHEGLIVSNLEVYSVTALLTILLGTPVAFFAIAGEGYLAPLGVVVVAGVLAQIIAAVGFGNLFPWAIPGLYSGAAGEYREELDVVSYSILVILSMSGYGATKYWFNNVDQTR